MDKPLVVIPSYCRKPEDVEVLMDTVRSIEATVPGETDVLVIDDYSPEEDVRMMIADLAEEGDFDFIQKRENEGFSRTVNAGLRKAVYEERDAVLMNADIEMDVPDWVRICKDTADADGNPAAVVGALLTYPQNGLIQHAGIYFSFLTRRFYERYKFAPPRLPAALRVAELPVTGAFQYLRYETLMDVGIYDERFRLGYEDVDYCLRVFKEGKKCVFNPNVRAYHFESMFRGVKSDKIRGWEDESFFQLNDKWRGENFAQYVPTSF